MKKVIFALFFIVLCAPVTAEENTVYCYNCKVYNTPRNEKRVVQPMVPVAPTPVTPIPYGYYYPYYQPYYPVIQQVPVVVSPPVCSWYPDPYTFLGDIFGYDYYPVCR